ncbi:DUF4402 domain-containing protein [Pedobacter petrophilus]|uniref:DUF4402 domain-containing protein n=1 Tax=Pedobacter petrophilus TaxID=1908241 RepID=A0A7K0FT31_9SPHI|nr:DUF4402 domain-containing protein [Pedobacter petrophilus]MRX74472.1 DUF4402 domain-containing protein [Pedobacter petrophilus]
MNRKKERADKIMLYVRIFMMSHLLYGSTVLYAQEKPPRPIGIYVNPAQGLIFGAFVHTNSGGSIIIYPNGSRQVTGSVVPANLGFSFSPAIFEVDAEPGTLITIINGPDVTLNGSNGGSMNLHIGTSSLASPFVTTAVPPSRTQLWIGGTLTVGNSLANPPGNYSGTFSVTFIQQ